MKKTTMSPRPTNKVNIYFNLKIIKAKLNLQLFE